MQSEFQIGKPQRNPSKYILLKIQKRQRKYHESSQQNNDTLSIEENKQNDLNDSRHLISNYREPGIMFFKCWKKEWSTQIPTSGGKPFGNIQEVKVDSDEDKLK